MFTFPHIFCFSLLSILSYEARMIHTCVIRKSQSLTFCLSISIRSHDARMIMYPRALYRSFKVKWIGKVYIPTHVLFIINTVIRGAHDNVPTCVIQWFQSLTYGFVLCIKILDFIRSS